MQFITSKSKSTLLGATAFLLATFVIVTVVTLGEQTETAEKNKAAAATTQNTYSQAHTSSSNMLQANYFMENFNIVSITAEGQPHRWLSGEKLSRFPDGTTRLTRPKIQIKTHASTNTSSLKQEKNISSEHWLLLAKNGTIEHDQKIMLDGDVQIQQINSKTKTLNIQTEHLEILLDKNIASTHNEVVVRNENGKINATGMQINLKEHQLKLLANVKGYYVFE